MQTNMNPQNPNTPGGMPAPAGQDPAQAEGMAQPAMAEPKNIRDYLALARSQGQVPTFTNIDNAPGFDVRQDPSYIQDQAISEGPDNEYEAEPWDQRVLKDPYLRTTQSLPRFLDEIWKSTPAGLEGVQRGQLEPGDPRIEPWKDQVKAVTGYLLKKYSKEHDLARRQREENKEQRRKDEQMWQKFYAQQNAAMKPPTREDGSVMSPSEFVEQQMAIADERQVRAKMAKDDKAEAPTGTYMDMEDQEIMDTIGENVDLGAAIKQKLVEALSQKQGHPITDEEFFRLAKDETYAETFRQLTKQAIDSFGEDIYELSQGGQFQKPADAAAGIRPGDQAMSVPGAQATGPAMAPDRQAVVDEWAA